ncbi:Ras-associated and pleckstrin-like proteiny domain-containing protein 1 [Heracleum sosnowskyi]|uniref:Ras-associated and pleckstrin-like proteiny domain-containing protein 1 n=1 Tax=Heracleum sosnowskyi TaxID=360622 RepID=A0AAD8MCI4_9APIA|nr:Ras-associated and pleckstrin-like proteiny domain-containing protein 1 [Heracleum sosnowskyi]
MGEEDHGGWSPTGAPASLQRDDHWRHFGNSVNAVSCGFVATAILILMFLVMAIFERFLRPTSPELAPSGDRSHLDMVSQMGFHGKLSHPSPKIPTRATEVSVLMPGEAIPTFIAQPAPVPCPLERVPWPPHNHI